MGGAPGFLMRVLGEAPQPHDKERILSYWRNRELERRIAFLIWAASRPQNAVVPASKIGSGDGIEDAGVGWEGACSRTDRVD